MRLLLTPLLRIWFRVRIAGADSIPAQGPAIIAPNHKSFLDPFFIGLATRRQVRFMAKSEMFRGPLARLLVGLGAFPVRRGEADVDAMQTARTILAQGGLVVIFPEGTRVEDSHALGAPHHGAGRLALESGAPVVPAAIAGTSHLWLAPLPKLRRIRLAFVPAIDSKAPGAGPDPVRELVDRELWPAVQEEYGRQLARPGLILAALAAIGVGGGLLARRQAKAKPRLLGVVEPLKARRRTARKRLASSLRRGRHRRRL